MSELWKEIAPYRCVDGLVHNRWCEPGERNPSDNGVAYTAATGVAVYLRGEMTPALGEEVLFTLQRCEDRDRPGLWHRGPFNEKQEGPDDYVWLVAFSAITGERLIARRVLRYGCREPFRLGPLTLYFNYCNVCRESVLHRSSFLGRQGQFVAHVRFATGDPTEWPSWWLRLWWALALLASTRAKREDQDAWMHSWALTYVTLVNERESPRLRLGWFARWARTRWIRAFNRVWPEGLSGPLATWLTDPDRRPHLSGVNHPLVRGWPKDQAALS